MKGEGHLNTPLLLLIFWVATSHAFLRLVFV